MKKIIQIFANFFGFKIVKIIKKEYREFDQILKKILKNNNNIIFDIGANKGQSLQRYRKLFNNTYFYSFEPSHSAFKVLKSKYGNLKNIKLFNIALGEAKKKKVFMNTKIMNLVVLIKLIKNLMKKRKNYLLRWIQLTQFLKKIN